MHTIAVPGAALAKALAEPHGIARPDQVWRVEGPGAIACLQGIFTNDLKRAGPASLTWGAVLTPKGMIITDLWLHREGDAATLIVPEAGAAPLREVLRRSFPPRLARITDLSATHACTWITHAPEALAPGLVLPSGPAPFAALVIGSRDAPVALPPASPTIADAMMLVAGWPVLGREMDERTLVQEVRFDELEGVRYDKGCYVGQETVARLHFRGHPNRTLRALVGRGGAPADPGITSSEGREIGVVATLLDLGGRWIASSKLRREVATGDSVQVSGQRAEVRDFPLSRDDWS